MIDLKNWDVMRIIRLVAGSLIMWSAFVDQQPMLGLLGGTLLLQAALNIGCGPAGCGVPQQRRRSVQSKQEEPVNDVTYEEV